MEIDAILDDGGHTSPRSMTYTFNQNEINKYTPVNDQINSCHKPTDITQYESTSPSTFFRSAHDPPHRILFLNPSG
jgi:hypothetical protein